MFKKLVAIEPVSLILSAEDNLISFAEDVVMYFDIPEDDEEIANRIDDADAVLRVGGVEQRPGQQLVLAHHLSHVVDACQAHGPYLWVGR